MTFAPNILAHRRAAALLAVLLGACALVGTWGVLRARTPGGKGPPVPEDRPAGAPEHEGTDAPNVMELIEAFRAEQQNESPVDPFRLFRPQDYPHIERARRTVGNVARNCFVVRQTCRMETTIEPSDGDVLLLAAAPRFAPNRSRFASVEFRAEAVRTDGRRTPLFATEWQNFTAAAAGWRTARVPLGDLAGENATLELSAWITADGPEPGPVAELLIAEPWLAREARHNRPNVVLIVLEATRRDRTSLHGYERDTTPFLRELARECLVFEDGLAQSSWTKPSVGSIMTGLPPAAHRALTATGGLPDAFDTMAELLRGGGYHTAAFWTARVILPPFGYEQGFDVFVAEDRELFEQVRRDAVRWIEREARQPFFLSIHAFDPHGPYAAPGSYRHAFASDYDGPLARRPYLKPGTLAQEGLPDHASARYVRDRYDAEVLYADRVLERLVADLKEHALWDESLVIITSDHGDALGEHGLWGHSSDLMPQLLRVPLLIKPPGGADGRCIAWPAGHVDLLPTVLGAAGLQPPDGLPGVDLLGAARADGAGRRAVHFAEFQTDLVSGEGPAQVAAVTEDYHCLAEFAPDGGLRLRLYDRRTDPDAAHDVAPERPEVTARFRAMLRERYGEDGPVGLFGAPAASAEPDAQTLEALKDLGYL